LRKSWSDKVSGNRCVMQPPLPLPPVPVEKFWYSACGRKFLLIGAQKKARTITRNHVLGSPPIVAGDPGSQPAKRLAYEI
jgi:hypothetical protein